MARARLPIPGSAGSMLLGARDVTVERGSRLVLDAVDLLVRGGEIVALVGPNGAGKSSLLGAIAGDLPLVRGEIRLDGAAIASWSPVEASMRRAVLLQQSRVAFPFLVREVVRMGRAPWAGTDLETADDRAVVDAMASADVQHLADRPVTELSGGERARVALARVLAQETDVILLDEPTAALDLHHQEQVMEVLRDRAGHGRAILIVLHDLDLAAAHADRVAVLDQGRAVADGAPAEVLTEVLLTSVYGRPIEVLPHPRNGNRIVMARRGSRADPPAA